MKTVILKFIHFYQKTRFFHGAIARQLFFTDQACRFIPTCSVYTYQAVKKYGTAKGMFIGLKRIIRCHPWSKGGNDPVK